MIRLSLLLFSIFFSFTVLASNSYVFIDFDSIVLKRVSSKTKKDKLNEIKDKSLKVIGKWGDDFYLLNNDIDILNNVTKNIVIDSSNVKVFLFSKYSKKIKRLGVLNEVHAQFMSYKEMLKQLPLLNKRQFLVVSKSVEEKAELYKDYSTNLINLGDIKYHTTNFLDQEKLSEKVNKKNQKYIARNIEDYNNTYQSLGQSLSIAHKVKVLGIEKTLKEGAKFKESDLRIFNKLMKKQILSYIKYIWRSGDLDTRGCWKFDIRHEKILDKVKNISRCESSTTKYLYGINNKKIESCDIFNEDDFIMSLSDLDQNSKCFKSVTKIDYEEQTDEKNHLTSCKKMYILNNSEKVLREELNIKECVVALTSKINYKFKKDKNNLVKGCFQVTKNGSVVRTNINEDDCLKENKQSISFSFVSNTNKDINEKCQAKLTTQKDVFFKSTREDCLGNYYEYGFSFIKDKKSGKYGCYKEYRSRGGYNHKYFSHNKISDCISSLNSSDIDNVFNFDDNDRFTSCSVSYKGIILTEINEKDCLKDIPLSYVPDFESGTYSKCAKIDLKTGNAIKYYDMQECHDKYSPDEFTFRKDKKENKILGCYRSTKRDGYAITDLKEDNYDECYRTTNNLVYLWRGINKEECSSYTKELTLIENNVEAHNCSNSSYHILWDKKVKSYTLLKWNDTYEGKTYEEIIKYERENMGLNALVESLTDDFKSFSFELDRDIYVYNYRKRHLITYGDLVLPDRGQVSIDNKITHGYLKEWMNATWKYTPGESGYVGWGLYAGNNPEVSDSYGGSYWGLSRVEIKKGARILDLRTEGDEIPVRKKTKEILYSLCRVSNSDYSKIYSSDGSEYSYVYSIDKRSLTNKYICNYAFMKALERARINAMIYKWNSTRISYCSNRTSYAAFVLTDVPINSKTVKFFVEEGSIDTKDWYESYLESYIYMNFSNSKYEKAIRSLLKDDDVKKITRNERDYIDKNRKELMNKTYDCNNDNPIDDKIKIKYEDL